MMNPTPDLNQRYLSGLPAQNGYTTGYPVPAQESQPAPRKGNLSQILLTVIGVAGLMLLVFYVTLIYPLVKSLRNAKENPSGEAKPLTAEAKTEPNATDPTEKEVEEEEEEEKEEETPEGSVSGPSSPRR